MSIPAITRFASATWRRQYPNVMHIAQTHARSIATSTPLLSPSEHTVVLDNQILYVDRCVAEALGWKLEQDSEAGVKLSLSGWGPAYFTIAPTGSDSGESYVWCCSTNRSHFVVIQDRLARAVVESSHNPNVKRVLDYLKER